MNEETKPVSRALTFWRVLFTLCTIVTVAYIFFNSSQTADVSAVRSGRIVELANAVFAKLGFGAVFTEHLVRKLAHLLEYMLLGFFLMLTLRVYTQRILSFLAWPLFGGLLIPVLDETLQAFRAGRSSELRDVLIDFSGVMIGLCAALLVLLVVRMVTVLAKSKTPL